MAFVVCATFDGDWSGFPEGILLIEIGPKKVTDCAYTWASKIRNHYTCAFLFSSSQFQFFVRYKVSIRSKSVDYQMSIAVLLCRRFEWFGVAGSDMCTYLWYLAIQEMRRVLSFLTTIGLL
jgi:hypothetical protein